MEDRPQVSLTIDGQEVSAPEGATILEAALGQGIAIPTLCHHAALTPWGGCRLCVVEVDGAPRLVAACVMPVRKGMEVVTTNERITQARRTVLEFLFAERPHYCMYCAQSGDCELQALAYAHGMDHLTVPTLDQVFPVDATHAHIALDHNRCVLCGRCVRACREIAGVRALDFHHRGGANTVGADLEGPLGGSSCVSCGACLQVCPTGAIFHRHRTHHAVLGKDRHWSEVESLCPRCGQLCPTTCLVRGDSLLKIQAPLPSPQAWQGQLCRKGRFEPFQETHPRLFKPMLRDGGGWREASWEEALDETARGLARARGSWLGLVSSDCCNEEIAAFRQLMGAASDTLDGALFRSLAQAGLGKLAEAPWEEVLEADLVLVVGAALPESHPMLESLLRRAMLDRGTRLAVLGRDARLGAAAHHYLPAAAPDLPGLVQDLAAGQPPAPPGDGAWQAQDWTGLAQAWAGAVSPLMVAGDQLGGAGQAQALAALAALARAKGALPGGQTRLIVLKPAGNSAGAWGLGAAAANPPAPGAAAGLICLDGEQGSPAQLLPGGQGPGFLALLTPYLVPAWAEQARVLLPKPTWLETEGAYASAGGQPRRKAAALTPPPEVPPAQETLAALARRLAE